MEHEFMHVENISIYRNPKFGGQSKASLSWEGRSAFTAMTSERPGDRIKSLRTQQKLTQEQLAKKAGISIGFLSDVETGTSNIGANKLLDIAEALEVSLDYLMKGEEAMPTATKPTPLELPAALVKLAEKLGLTVGQARRLLGIQHQIIGFRSDRKSSDLENVDWDKLYALVNKEI